MAKRPNMFAWLKRLEPIRYEAKDKLEEGRLERMSLGSALLALAEINHDNEYSICHSLADHLLGEAPEPDDADVSEE